MSDRVLTQVTVSFLLGITASRYGGLWWQFLWLVWLIYVGRNAYRQNCRYLPVILRVLVCMSFCMLGQYRYSCQHSLVHSTEAYLSDKTEITAAGTIWKKEEKNWNIVYYLKDSYIIGNTDCQSGGQILIYHNTDEFSIGDTIKVTGACESFRKACNEGNFDERDYYYSKGILFGIRAKSVTLLKRKRFLWQEQLYRLRKEIQQVYLSKLPQEEAGVLGVMTLGEKGMIDAELKKLYQQSGISHVLAISGLHISILGMGIYRFLRKRHLSYLGSGMAAGFVVLLFGQISGMELSTRRAVLMFLVLLIGNAAGLAYDSVTALSLSALLQLMENPYCLWYAGFLFSYSAVLAVVVAVKILKNARGTTAASAKKEKHRGHGKRRWIYKEKKILFDTIFTSSCIQLVTLPLTVYFYYEVPVYSVLINGILLPLMGVVLLSGITGGLVGIFPGVLFSFFGKLPGMLYSVLDVLCWLLLRPAYFLLCWNEWICSFFGMLPGSLLITGRPPMWMMVVYYAVLITALWVIDRVNREPAAWIAVGRSAGKMQFPVRTDVVKISALAAAIAALAILLWVRPEPKTEVCFLDVGQGDGIFLQAEDGTTFMIDGGSTDVNKVGEYRILSFLKYRGIGQVDGWFVSHQDEDHVSGLLEVWESGYKIERLFLSQWMVRDEAWEQLCSYAEEYRTEIVYLKPGDCVGTGNLKLTCLFPEGEGTDRNGNSLVLKLTHPKFTAVFAGDISEKQERELVSRYPSMQADLYKAIHHGSDGSNSRELLDIIKPVACVVSCGEDNSYGHPGREAVQRIEESGSRIYYTMESGQITVGADEQGLWVKEYK